ncbi:MAG: glycoside hydrolase family 3 N-terminal domain-containing protein [Chloroflexota bacterium]
MKSKPKLVSARFAKILVLLVMVIAQTVGIGAYGFSASAASDRQTDLDARVRQIMAQMSPEQKVGQLFLVTFKGTDARRDSPIYKLIVDYKVGGVVLRADNDNFEVAGNTVPKAAELIRALQNHVWDASQTQDDSSATTVLPYIPLFIGISQEGDLYPNDQIMSGMTSLPSLMAIGATWDTSAAEAVGTVMGKELRAIGFNLYFGPSLDVLEVTTTSTNMLGVRTFGGDPFWVGELGKAYIRGLHLGSRDQMAVIAKHFPGRGASDRLPEEEVATVRKSLDALRQIELAPFFASMQADVESKMRIDGVMVSHIRYQGLQENIREITPPVSLDGEAMRQVLTLEPVAEWYNQGGVIISDNLGSNAVRRFYDPTGQTFDARAVARNAFLAGNDLLYLNNFIEPTDVDSTTTMIKVLESFAQKYREDPAFAERVDQSVERILKLKLRLFGEFRLDRVLPPASQLAEVGRSQSVALEVARKAATLLSPSAAELNIRLPRPPENRDQIIFFTDVVSAKQCSTCGDQWILSPDSLKNAIIRLYGPAAGGSIIQGYLFSYTFLDLNTFLNNPEGLTALGVNLADAEWVVFALTGDNLSRPEAQALKRLLSERPDLILNKKVIVFAFGAPYLLDATDIAKLTAYYGLYSKAPAFVDTAARILFHEQSAEGASPVSIPGIGYDIIRATSPDPAQVIPLYLDLPIEPETTETAITPQPTEPPAFKVGDVIPFRTGVILDQNGNPVPDGTIVKFIITSQGENGTSQQIETVTAGGIAKATYRINTPAMVEIRVVSEPAMTSQILSINAQNGEAVISTDIPTLQPTMTLTPTTTPTPQSTESVEEVINSEKDYTFADWLTMLLIVGGGGVGIAFIGQRRISLRWGFRWGLLSVIGGVLAYLFLVSGWFVPLSPLENTGRLGVTISSLIGLLVGWGIGWVWQIRLQKNQKYMRKN